MHRDSVISIDMGGTKVLGCVVNSKEGIIASVKKPTDPTGSRKKYVHQLAEIVFEKCISGLVNVLKDARDAYQRIDTVDRGTKPRIGVVGEIYIRSNAFSNEHIVKSLEKLGGEVWLPPISEWFLYLNFTSRRYSLENRRYFTYWKNYITEMVQHRDEHALGHIWDGHLVNHPEPSILDTLLESKPYLDDSFEGEAVLSVGKCGDYIRKGVSGLVNVMPFTCMPGTIVGAVMKRYRWTKVHGAEIFSQLTKRHKRINRGPFAD